MSRCDSAAIVPNTSELLPEPETPVKTVNRRLGSSTLTSLRLFTRAPCTRMRSWPSAACMQLKAALRGGRLVDPHEVAGRVAHGAVARAPRLVGRLLHDLGVGGLQSRERAVEVVGVEVDAVQRALGDKPGERVVVG